MKMDEDEDREPIAMNYYILSLDSARQRKQARLFATSPDRYSAKPLSLRGQSCQDAYLLDAQLFFTRRARYNAPPLNATIFQTALY